MTIYIYTADKTVQQTPVLKKGKVQLTSEVAVFWSPGENPTITEGRCALLKAGETKTINLPVKCTKIAFKAVKALGKITISEHPGGARASCSV